MVTVQLYKITSAFWIYFLNILENIVQGFIPASQKAADFHVYFLFSGKLYTD